MILHHLGCIEPCKMDRSGTNQQTPIWFAQNWTSETTQSDWTVGGVAEGGKFLLRGERGMARCGCQLVII